MQTDTRVHKAKGFVVAITVVGLIGVGLLSIQAQKYWTSLSEYFSPTSLVERVENMGRDAIAQSNIDNLYYNYYQAQAVAQANLALAQWWH